MKWFLMIFLSMFTMSAFANVWTYQVNINSDRGTPKRIDESKSKFDAGPYYCEVTPVTINNGTEFRSLVCSVGTGTVSTGALCTKAGSKFPSVQYAILNLAGPKHVVNVVVACEFK